MNSRHEPASCLVLSACFLLLLVQCFEATNVTFLWQFEEVCVLKMIESEGFIQKQVKLVLTK